MGLHIYCDGGYQAQNDTGGWAYIIYRLTDNRAISIKRLDEQHYQELQRQSGWQKQTSSLEMELRAAQQALLHLKRLEPAKLSETAGIGKDVTLFTDSRIIIEGLEQKYPTWLDNNWRVKSGKTVVYKELWQSLQQLTQELGVRWQWVKAHSGVMGNTLVDQLATSARDQRLSTLDSTPA